MPILFVSVKIAFLNQGGFFDILHAFAKKLIKPLDFCFRVCYTISCLKLNILIKSGGGTGPMKPNNLHVLQGVKS